MSGGESPRLIRETALGVHLDARASLGRSLQLLIHLDEHRKMGDRDADSIRAGVKAIVPPRSHILLCSSRGKEADDLRGFCACAAVGFTTTQPSDIRLAP